ncbi:amidohydrolase [Nonomuraea sp. NPDC050328]|uniref:amidohydrolase n=1 Tax=Nonomuraea sp. NPDC050328 TaxID=3364361 RepID=UPI0037A88824
MSEAPGPRHVRGVADLIIVGRIRTFDPVRPLAGALAVGDGRILALGEPHDLDGLRGPRTVVADAGDGCVLPGFVEAHGHFVADGLGAAGGVVDVRPVTAPNAEAVLAAIDAALATRPETGVLANGWDALLQPGLPRPGLDWLDRRAPACPLVVLHNSGHLAYFNSAAARQAGLDEHPGEGFGRTPQGTLDGTATGPAAIGLLTAPFATALLGPGFTTAMAAQSARLAARGITTMSDMGFAPAYRPALEAARTAGAIRTRLRLYEPATPALASAVAPGAGDDLVRQVGIKVWADGSPWVGTLAATFPYLDTAATRALGLPPGHRAAPRYDHAELAEIFQAYGGAGWQLACHANGDAAIDLALDVWEELAPPPAGWPRLRLEHVSAMRQDQFARAHALGVTCSLFPDHLHHWGEVLADELFGPEVAARWAPAGSAVRAGMRVSLHNDSPVTPADPLHNVSVAATRTTRRGRTLGAAERISVAQALRAQTADAAWQLLAGDVVGTLAPGRYADLAVLPADPLAVEPEAVAGLEVLATFLGGVAVHGGLPRHRGHPRTLGKDHR